MHNYTCWIEVNLNAIRHNVQQLQAHIRPEVDIIAVIKANAYGHGAPAVAKALTGMVRAFAVTRLQEAKELREAGVAGPIQLLGPIYDQQANYIVQLGVTPCVGSFDDVMPLALAASRAGRDVKVQIKTNTGMSRFGVEPAKALQLARHINALPHLVTVGAYTHFANAAAQQPRGPQVPEQFKIFQAVSQELAEALNLPKNAFHCANSAATLAFPQTRMNCVRVGTLLFGQFPTREISKCAPALELQQTFVTKSRIVAIRTVKPGEYVGYGSEWTPKKPRRIAIVAAGFADGLVLEPQTRTQTFTSWCKSTFKGAYHLLPNRHGRFVTIHQKKAPIVGRISMQNCAVDIEQIPQAKIGDEVVVPMRRLSASATLPRIYQNS